MAYIFPYPETHDRVQRISIQFMGMKNSKTTILTVLEMTLHESAPPLLGPALGVQKPVIKKLKENF